MERSEVSDIVPDHTVRKFFLQGVCGTEEGPRLSFASKASS